MKESDASAPNSLIVFRRLGRNSPAALLKAGPLGIVVGGVLGALGAGQSSPNGWPSCSINRRLLGAIEPGP